MVYYPNPRPTWTGSASAPRGKPERGVGEETASLSAPTAPGSQGVGLWQGGRFPPVGEVGGRASRDPSNECVFIPAQGFCPRPSPAAGLRALMGFVHSRCAGSRCGKETEETPLSHGASF